MNKILIALPVLILLFSLQAKAQNPSQYLPNKPGKWSYSIHIKTPGADYVAFNKNLSALAEWFHQNTPMLKNPTGYDLHAVSYGKWNDNYKKNVANYGLRSEMVFSFQLFLSDHSRGGKWTVEPPAYSFDINNTEAGHGTNPNYKYFSVSEHDPAGVLNISQAQEQAINEAVAKLNGIFMAFPFEKELAPGVHIYKESVDGHFRHVIVFSPERPAYWLPVTVKEMADIYLEYYTNLKDEFILPHLKKEIAEYSAEELNATAFNSHDTHFLLKANGKGEGLQFMRFNPDYWDRSLPPSAIQLMTFRYLQMTDYYIEEFYKNNGHPNYVQLMVNQLNWKEAARLIGGF